ncbi:MAG TPA: peptidylprolyl isomerase [Patescibacteria group bacterium]|nr:peptidylprolyl isomerase [Patescibacteria group bacterium]
MTRSQPRPFAASAASVVLFAAILAGCSAAGIGGGATIGPSARASSPAPSAPAGSAAPSGAQGDCPTAQPAALPAGEKRTVTIDTTKGAIALQIDGTLSPIAAGNIVALADCGWYDGVVFHRVVPDFVIQGGDGEFGRVGANGKLAEPAQAGTGGPGYTIKDEPVTAPYGRGVVAMARTSDPDSVGSQFFIVLSDKAADVLKSYNTYQIVGKVTSGMDVVDAIAAAADAENPTNPVVMTKVTVSP